MLQHHIEFLEQKHNCSVFYSNIEESIGIYFESDYEPAWEYADLDEPEDMRNKRKQFYADTLASVRKDYEEILRQEEHLRATILKGYEENIGEKFYEHMRVIDPEEGFRYYMSEKDTYTLQLRVIGCEGGLETFARLLKR